MDTGNNDIQLMELYHIIDGFKILYGKPFYDLDHRMISEMEQTASLISQEFLKGCASNLMDLVDNRRVKEKLQAKWSQIKEKIRKVEVDMFDDCQRVLENHLDRYVENRYTKSYCEKKQAMSTSPTSSLSSAFTGSSRDLADKRCLSQLSVDSGYKSVVYAPSTSSSLSTDTRSSRPVHKSQEKWKNSGSEEKLNFIRAFSRPTKLPIKPSPVDDAILEQHISKNITKRPPNFDPFGRLKSAYDIDMNLPAHNLQMLQGKSKP